MPTALNMSEEAYHKTYATGCPNCFCDKPKHRSIERGPNSSKTNYRIIKNRLFYL